MGGLGNLAQNVMVGPYFLTSFIADDLVDVFSTTHDIFRKVVNKCYVCKSPLRS